MPLRQIKVTRSTHSVIRSISPAAGRHLDLSSRILRFYAVLTASLQVFTSVDWKLCQHRLQMDWNASLTRAQGIKSSSPYRHVEGFPKRGEDATGAGLEEHVASRGGIGPGSLLCLRSPFSNIAWAACQGSPRPEWKLELHQVPRAISKVGVVSLLGVSYGDCGGAGSQPGASCNISARWAIGLGLCEMPFRPQRYGIPHCTLGSNAERL